MHLVGLMHGWVDQFATKPKSLFTQKSRQILEITISLHQFSLTFFIFFLCH
jgi:hypothetical protein